MLLLNNSNDNNQEIYDLIQDVKIAHEIKQKWKKIKSTLIEKHCIYDHIHNQIIWKL